jgi:hypothetical protein
MLEARLRYESFLTVGPSSCSRRRGVVAAGPMSPTTNAPPSPPIEPLPEPNVDMRAVQCRRSYGDQYDLGMEYSGYAAPGEYDRVVFRGSVPAREFLAFWVKDGRVLAGMNVNVWDVQDDIQALIRAGCEGKPVDLDRLADPDVPLAELAS